MAFPSGWNQKVEFVINPDTSAFSNSILGFPVVITENANSFPSSTIFTGDTKARPNGGDIRFTSGSDGSGVLPLELEQFNQDTSAFVAHVKLPDTYELSGTSQSIYMWWGVGDTWQPEASATTSGSENVWNEEHLFVSHMNDYQTSGAIYESTSASDTWTKPDSDVAYETSGVLYNSQFIDTSGAYISGAGSNIDSFENGDTIKLTCWVKLDNVDNLETYHYIISDSSSATSTGNFGFAVYGGDNPSGFEGLLYFYYWDGNVFQDVYSTSGVPIDGNFHHISYQFTYGTSASMQMLIDGKSTGLADWEGSTLSAGPTPRSGRPVIIGSPSGFGDGSDDHHIDELRLLKLSSSADTSGTSVAQYENVNSQSTFVSAGIPQSVGSTFPNDWSNKTKFILNVSAINETTTMPVNIPSSFITTEMWNNVQADGGDIRITTDLEGNNLLPTEVVFWDNTISATEIWVKTQVDVTSGGDFYVWYNTSATESQPVEDIDHGRYNVWDSEFKMVQHMYWKRADTPEGEYGFIDSTRNNNDAIIESNFFPDYNSYDGSQITCANDGMGSYYAFGGHQGYNLSGFNIPDHPSLRVNTDNYYLEGFVKPTMPTNTNTQHQIFSKGDANPEYEIQLDNATTAIAPNTFYNRLDPDPGPATIVWNDVYDPYVQNDWYYVGGLTVSGGGVYSFVNGTSGTITSANTGIDTDDSTPLLIGRDFDALNEEWIGAIDEIRLTSGAIRSANWISTQSNIISGESLYSFVGDPVSGVGSLTLPEVDVSGVGTVKAPLSATGNLTLPELNVSGVGITIKDGTGSLTLPEISVSGVARILRGSGALTLPAVDVSGTGRVPPSGIGQLVLPELEINGTGTVDPLLTPEQDQLDVLLDSRNEIPENWAYDLAKNSISKGEAFDDEVINLSIENIISTLRGERVFAPEFGTILPLVLFEQLNQSTASDLLDIILRAIRRYEKRITVINEQVQINILTDQNAFTLVIPYIINRNSLVGTFSKKVIL